MCPGSKRFKARIVKSTANLYGGFVIISQPAGAEP
nr:MAG TPA: hypothetical protein [Caudoviricetes sp.]